ncbi:sensor histidine kinase [Paenibacillus aceris]|uniref:Two-component system sensor histidine kinase YesM n=1 Tax=Paenibacillus aceris TaxID=869555 RepID=A0ABS4HZ92_9BACL|nr:histidine kinase [Paenibacillus aceris]MBP1963991.1 two-component system sensor histidine kinase YesM [Paenibacillus aceris]NHW34591.1 histidine kinase [Paenibacillus aceris]
MPYKLNIFSKILIMLVLLLIPIVLLYSYTNRITNNVVQDQIQSSNLNQLSFFMHQLDTDVERLAMSPVILGSDPYMREYINRSDSPDYDVLKEQSRIIQKLSLQSVSSGWVNELTVAIPRGKQVLSSSIFVNGTDVWPWHRAIQRTWTYEERESDKGVGSFIREISEPIRAQTMDQANVLYQVRFSVQNMVQLLDVYKQDKRSDPFFVNGQKGLIVNSSSNSLIINAIREQFTGESLPSSGQVQLVIDRQQYLISYVKSAQLGWYLMDYVPVQKILSPITMTRKLFYISIGLLLVMSVLASFMLYRNVQIPIGKMIQSVQKVKRGDLSARIDYKAKNEFDFLIQRFNEMAAQMQVLVEDVYAEKIRSREATLKQLQSQIHPHFLYNSLFFIINSAEMEDKESVVAMAQNLAEFYRYTTRVEKQSVTLGDELDLVGHYLNIQHLRIHRLKYDISVPEQMLSEWVPRLILQPLVENAIVHGIERSAEGDRIVITGEQDEDWNRIIVEDNGAGLDEFGLTQLLQQLYSPMTDDIGCGTWNVHHRLYYQFGEGSGLTFYPGEQGGLKAVLTWKRGTQINLPAASGENKL